MKLFKKLAAAALAAVLALSMVGCGNANSVNSTKQLTLDMISEFAAMNDAEINNTAEMDDIAQNLLNKAAELYGADEYAGAPVVTLLEAASKEKDMGFDATKTYLVSYAEDYQYKSSLVSNVNKQYNFFMNLLYKGFTVSQQSVSVNLRNVKKADVGVAVGKIGDKTYVVMVTMPTETAAAPGTGKD